MEELHVGDVVDVDFNLEDNNECLAVELDGEDRGREEELADHGLPLRANGGSESVHIPERWKATIQRALPNISMSRRKHTFVLTI